MIGEGLTNGEWVYVPIPKNANTAHRQALSDWETTTWHYETHGLRSWAVIRHPVDRYFSGVAQYAFRTKSDPEHLLDGVEAGGWPVLDEHTARQTDYLLSTLPDTVLVPLGAAGRWLETQFRRTLQQVNVRRAKPSRPRMVPFLEEFYADDLALYEEASNGGLASP